MTIGPFCAALDVKRLGVHVACDCAVEVRVAREIRSVARRKRGIDIVAVPGKIIIFLGDVDLRAARNASRSDCGHGVCRKERSPQKNNDE